MTDISNVDNEIGKGILKIKQERVDENEATEDNSVVYLHLTEEILSLKSDDDDGKFPEEMKIKTEIDEIIIIDEDDDDCIADNPDFILDIKTEQNIDDEEEEQQQQQEKKDEQETNVADADATVQDGGNSKPEQSTATTATDNVVSNECTSTNETVKSDIPKPQREPKPKTKPTNDDQASTQNRNLWVMNLLPSTRAMELKQLMSRCGKVNGAKIVQSSKNAQNRCYGFVTMDTQAAADRCVEELNNVELNGQPIRVAKVKSDYNIPKSLKKSAQAKPKDEKKIKAPNEADKETKEKKEKEVSSVPNPKQTDNKKGNKKKSRKPKHSETKDKSTQNICPKSGAEYLGEVLAFEKTKAALDRERARTRSLRQDEQHRREIQLAHEIIARQRMESERLDRERERLRVERERLTREREELMRLERERQRLERQKLEEERKEFRRQEMLLEQVRRTVKRCAEGDGEREREKEREKEKRFTDGRGDEVFDILSRQSSLKLASKKSPSPDYHSRSAFKERMEEYRKRELERKRDYAPVEAHVSSGSSASAKASTYVKDREIAPRRKTSSAREPSPRAVKDTRYRERSNDRSSIPFRPVREERDRRLDREPVREERDRRLEREPVRDDRERRLDRDRDHHMKSEARPSRDVRYAAPPSKEGPYFHEPNWHSTKTVLPEVKQFNSVPEPPRGIWRPMNNNSGQRWDNHSSRIMMSSGPNPPIMYSGSNLNNPALSSVLASAPMPPSYPIERFDRFKSNNSRLY